MVRYKLKDKYLKSKSELYKQRWERYNKQGCPLFWNKSYSSNSRVTLLKNGHILGE